MDKNLSAVEILKIIDSYDLFKTVNEKTCKEVLQRLQAYWHPDRNHDPMADKVMSHIHSLYDRFMAGDLGSVFQFTESDNARSFAFKFKKVKTIDVGKMYIGTKMVLFQLTDDNADLFDKAIQAIQSIRFPSKMLEAGFNRLVPKEIKVYKRTNQGNLFTVYKGPDQVNLSDVLDTGTEIQPGHLTWILEGIYNFVLFMSQVQNKMYGGLELDNIFVNPKFRTIHVLGGWWFAETLNKPLKALPNWIIPILSNKIIKDKTTTSAIDQVAVKALGLQLLGDSSMIGTKLLKMDKKYHPMISFLRLPHSENAIKDYGEWMKATKDLPRLDLPLTFNDVYR